MSQPMESALRAEPIAGLVADAQAGGDAARGAVLFHQGYLTCTQCHMASDGQSQLGPKLSELGNETTQLHLVESLLFPSKVIRKGFEPVAITTTDGQVKTGIVESKNDTEIRIRIPGESGIQSISVGDIDTLEQSDRSLMPDGLVNLLSSRQQFLDICKYLFEIAEGGPERERELKPARSLYAATIPEYESDIDHAGMISSLDDESYKRGAKIYNRLCINCHGTVDKPGSLPTSLAFASGKFKNGSDPFSMYQTLTRGYGMMVAQSWMVPQQKYDVIHYVREAYLKPHNQSQLVNVDDTYLASLPKGNSRGPEPSNIEPWSQMDYGPSLVNTYEVGNDGKNFAYKGIAVRLDAGPGGVAHGNSWIIFDHDTMRVAAAWTGDGFIDWNGIHFNGRHGIHP
ncbi:MAG: c-type cytochrome, partial [Planctomycetales bacterium]|nr:c-type cytochrome [Planctomycetales bacterium]